LGSVSIIERDGKGRFLPGQSGNAAGKQKGLRNYITHERLMLEAALRDYVADPTQSEKLLKGIDRILEVALNGEDKTAMQAMKLLLDRVMPAMPVKEAEEAQKTNKRLEIVIRTNPDATTPIQVINGEYTTIEDNSDG